MNLIMGTWSVCKSSMAAHPSIVPSRLHRRPLHAPSMVATRQLPRLLFSSRKHSTPVVLPQALGNGVAQEIPPDGVQRPATEEKFLSLSDILAEAAQLGDDFVFEDDNDDPVWDLEHKLKREKWALEDAVEMPELEDALPPVPAPAPPPPVEDIVSAYSQDRGFIEITAEDLQGHLAKGMRILDVRSAAEYSTGHIAGALNVPFDSLSDAVRNGDLDTMKSTAVAVICGSGQRSAQACVRLSRVFGFSKPMNVSGGMAAWTAAGHPTEAN